MPQEMSAEEAKSAIEELGCTADAPALSEALVLRCVTASARQDSLGYAPTSENWKPTYDIAAGLVLVWRLKASKAAGKFDFGSDRQTFKRSQVVEHCRQQADFWESQMEAVVGRITTYEDISMDEEAFWREIN